MEIKNQKRLNIENEENVAENIIQILLHENILEIDMQKNQENKYKT